MEWSLSQAWVQSLSHVVGETISFTGGGWDGLLHMWWVGWSLSHVVGGMVSFTCREWDGFFDKWLVERSLSHVLGGMVSLTSGG